MCSKCLVNTIISHLETNLSIFFKINRNGTEVVVLFFLFVFFNIDLVFMFIVLCYAWSLLGRCQP